MLLESVVRRVALAIAAAVFAGPVVAQPAQTSQAKVAAAVTTIQTLLRPGRDNLATVWDGDKYVQCRRTADALRCEAAGALMQPSLTHVLTPERINQLAVLGWSLDPSFGNYVRTFPVSASAGDVADQIMAALAKGYAADLPNLEIETKSIASEACPPRNGPSQNLAGVINDAPSMAAVSVHACAYAPRQDNATAADLIKLYGPRVTAEIGRLRVNMRREVFLVLDTGLGYVQCQPETESKSFYCEAASVDSWAALKPVLTPERIASLHAAGFTDPGRAPNYSKTYPTATTTDAALAAELLTVLHDAYGYVGASPLEVQTEKGG